LLPDSNRNRRALIPGTLTVFNLLCGFLSVRYAVEGNFLTASWLIILAAVFDGLDGTVARLTRGYSRFGIEFDSLADVVSFGVAPSVLIYLAHFQYLGTLGVLVSFLPLAFGAVRLARFNVTQAGFEKENFLGLPIPIQASALASYILFSRSVWGTVRFSAFFAPLVLFLSFLMVSHFEYETLPKFTLRKSRKNSVKLGLFLFASLLIIFFPDLAIFPLAMSFILWGFIRGVVLAIRHEDEIYDIST